MARRTADVEFRLLLDHDEFTPEVQADFRSALAGLTDCSADDIRILGIRPGCINVRIRMPDEAAKQFLEMFWKYCQENRNLEALPPELQTFLTTHKVDDFTARVGLDIHVKTPPKHRAVVFVHGWTGDEDTFGKWPSLLWDEFRCESEVFRYPTGILSHSPSTIYIADALANRLRNRYKASRLAFIAHSLGGLIVRRCIVAAQEQRDRLDLNVRSISFIASPHNGTILATAASKIPGLTSDQIRELADSSAVLYDLNLRWALWVKEHVPETCHLQSLFGTADKIVTGVNAIGTSEETAAILDKDHTSIVDVAAPTDEVAESVRRFLLEQDFFADDPRDSEQQRIERAIFNRQFHREPGEPREAQPAPSTAAQTEASVAPDGIEPPEGSGAAAKPAGKPRD